MLKSIISSYLREIADKIDNDELSCNELESLNALNSIMHLELNKSEAASRLGMSTRTFDRKIKEGEIPEGRHELGSKLLIWYLDELLEIKNKL